jgi:hypothetical protein
MCVMVWRSFARVSLFVVALCVVLSGLFAKKKPPEKPVNISTATSAASVRNVWRKCAT